MVTAAGHLLWGLRRSKPIALLLGLVLLLITTPARADTTVQDFRVFVSASGDITTVMVQWTAVTAEIGTSFVVYRSEDSSQGDLVCEQDYFAPGPYWCGDETAALDVTYFYHLVERTSSRTETILVTFGPILLQEPVPTPTPTLTAAITPMASATPQPTPIPATETPVSPTAEPPQTVESSTPPATSATQPVPATPTVTAIAAQVGTATSTRPPAAAQPDISPIPTRAVRPSPSVRRTPGPDVLAGNVAGSDIQAAEPTPDRTAQAVGPAWALLTVAAVAGVGGIALGIAALVLWRRGVR